MRALVVAGARPNFMKVAPLLEELQRAGHATVFVHTGQHYDAQLSDAFFTDLELPPANVYLGIGSGSHAQQTARVMTAFEPVLEQAEADWVVLVGDVNSTLACALVAAKMNGQTGSRVAHVEAGLRSRDWRMPEEINRVLTDRLSDLLLTPSRDAEPNLVAEGIPVERIVFAGNVMIDTLMRQLPKARRARTADKLGVTPGSYLLITLHRPSNVDDAATLATIVDGLALLASDRPVLMPVHPRTRERLERFGLIDRLGPVRLIEPLGYTDMVSLIDAAAAVLTDSGGVQEETTVLGVPCLTLREQTERPVTITEGTNRLAPWPLTTDGIVAATEISLGKSRLLVGTCQPEGWDGRAAVRIVQALEQA